MANMGVDAPQAPMGGWVHDTLKILITGPSLLDNCHLENEFHEKSG